MSLLVAGTAGLVGISGTAQAQGATFTTTGFFSSNQDISGYCTPTTQGTAATVATCTGPAADPYTLVFTGSSFVNREGSINFGTFALTSPNPTDFSFPSGVNLFFNLVVTQSLPQSGGSTQTGSITGTIQASGSNSMLIFVPDNSQFNIGTATYTFNYDNSGPAAGIGYNIPISSLGDPGRTINATVVTPEPATLGLFATGLFGLVPMVKIRRRKTTTLA